MQRVPIGRFHWPLAAALGLFLLEFLIGDRRQTRRGQFPVAATALIAFAFLAATNLAEASEPRATYNDGVQCYRNGDLDSATQAFQNTIENSDDLSLQTRAYYNLGNAIFKTGAAKLGDTVTGITTPIHAGRRTSVWQTRITTSTDKLVAVVTQTQMVL